MKIVSVTPTTDRLWFSLADQHSSDVFHSPEWMRVLTETYGFRPQARILIDEAGNPKAGIACCSIEDAMDRRIVSLPFSDFCDPLVNNQDEWRLLATELLDEGSLIKLRCLHNQAPLGDERFALINRAKWHCVDLQPDLDVIWEQLNSSSRRAIRKARRKGVTVRVAPEKEALRAFFELHLGVRKYKYQMVAQPYRFFESIWEHFLSKEKGDLIVSEHDGKIIGGVLFLRWQNKLYYKFNASDPDYLELRPNDLVIWEGIQYGKSLGCMYLDMGLSDWDQEGLIRYKNKFATQEKTISFLQHTPSGMPSAETQQIRHLLPQLTDLFTDESVPDSITEKAGDVLYRFFT